jgi:segregation and condensation protein B
LEKELIVIAGRKEEAVGKPLVYATSRQFMDYLGINSNNELPKLKEIITTETITPTDASEALPNEERDDDSTSISNMVVDDKGGLHEAE